MMARGNRMANPVVNHIVTMGNRTR